MIKKPSRFISFLRYAGVTKAEFNKVKAPIAEENHKVWRIAVAALEIIFLLAFVITASSPDLKQYVPGYIILVAYFMVVTILLLTVIKPQSSLFKPLIYLNSIVMIGMLLYQGFFTSPERNIATYCAIIVVISILSIDRPYRFCALILASTITFVLLILYAPSSTNQPWYPDLFVGVIFGIISVFITVYINHIRVKDIVMRYAAEQERDMDSLTGVKNKNAYDRMVESLMNRARRANLEFALVVFDINGLKLTNDTYGHESGDKLLIRATAMISDAFPNCYIYRIGGDEFATFITGTNYEKRNAIVGEFRKQIEDINDRAITLKEDTSIACGLAAFDPDVDRDYVSLFSRADASMYENKRLVKSKNKFLIS